MILTQEKSDLFLAIIEDENIKILEEFELEEFYQDFLDDIYGQVNIGGYKYDTSMALKNIDPTAYRCGFNDWLDSEYQEITFTANSGKLETVYISKQDYDYCLDGNI